MQTTTYLLYINFSASEENFLCYDRDITRGADIGLHEVAHGVHRLGASYEMWGLEDRLKRAFSNSISKGLWRKTYASRNHREYFAEGVMNWFNVNLEANPPDGMKNHVNTKKELEEYDPGLYDVIKLVFPCQNQFIPPCEKNRTKEMEQVLRMDCDRCFDYKNEHQCVGWKNEGYCTGGKYQTFMFAYCAATCGTCPTSADADAGKCRDWDIPHDCEHWKKWGYCSEDHEEFNFMSERCAATCGICHAPADDG